MANQVVWIINKDAAPTKEYATHIRSTREAQYLDSIGYDVYLICGNRVHNTSIIHSVRGRFSIEEHDKVKYVFIKSLRYKNSFIKRVLSYFYFSLKVLRIKELPKPNVIIHDTKTPFDYFVSKLANRYKAKYIVDVEDLWPRCFEFMGYVSHANPLMKIFYYFEKRLYTLADHVVFTMEGCFDYIREKKWDIDNGGSIDLAKIHYVNNGIVLQEFEENLKQLKIEDNDLEDNHIFKIIYLGSIREANDLGQLINAAKFLSSYSDIRFFIYGDGPDRKRLETRCVNEGINNVLFKQKWIDPKYVPYVLSKANVNVLNYTIGWAHYGGSMNKMFMSFASGKPIVCNADLSYSEIKRHNLGIDAQLDTPEKYAKAFLSIYHLSSEDYSNMCERVRDVANNYDVSFLMKKFVSDCGL